jgi:hypothetical protein
VSTTADAGELRAWGWVHHLRDGGTTPWATWTGTQQPSAAVLPGAQQLELLRRLNLTGDVPATLARRVLEASAVGRGRPDLELVGAARPDGFGPRAADPAELPPHELLRVAATVLADDLVASGVPAQERPPRAVPWRTRYRLAGDPELVTTVRADLVARRRPPGGRGPRVVVLATDLDRMVADAWTARCFDRGVPAWPIWLRGLVRSQGLPAPIDVGLVARRWAARVGPDRVHLVLDQAELPDVVGVRRLPGPPPALAAAGADLARRIGAVLGLLVPGEVATALLRRRLRPRLAEAHGPALGVPPERRDWLLAHAERMAEEIRRDRYAVHGSPDVLLSGSDATVGAPSPADTLDLALRMMLSGAPGRTSEEES